MREYAIIGSGIGGSTIASYLHAKGHSTILFEKEPYLGGCSSTFQRKGFKYNTGATTLSGYQEGHRVKRMLDAIGCQPQLIATDPAITVIHEGKITPRYKDLEKFLKVLNENYPHLAHDAFWRLVHTINRDFFAQEGYYYSNRSFFKKLRSLVSYTSLYLKFSKYLHTNALQYIETYYGTLDDSYLQFLEAQVRIVAQAPLKEINFLTAALALGYSFQETHYVKGGFGQLFDTMTAPMEDIKRSTVVKKITQIEDYYLIETSKNIYRAKNIILNSTIYESQHLFGTPKLGRYYADYEKHNNFQSAFMVYMTIKSDQSYQHHYQIIQKQPFVHTLSDALFVSLSDQNDRAFAPKGHYSITASILTDSRFWEDKRHYQSQKAQLQAILSKKICAILNIQEDQIVDQFSATPQTFARYIHRSQLGGNAMTMHHPFYKLPANDTPFKGLYHVGDTVYAAQGWPGVMMGVENLIKVIDG